MFVCIVCVRVCLCGCGCARVLEGCPDVVIVRARVCVLHMVFVCSSTVCERVFKIWICNQKKNDRMWFSLCVNGCQKENQSRSKSHWLLRVNGPSMYKIITQAPGGKFAGKICGERWILGERWIRGVNARTRTRTRSNSKDFVYILLLVYILAASR